MNNIAVGLNKDKIIIHFQIIPKMDWRNRLWRACTRCAANNFANQILDNMERITSTDIIYNSLYRNLLIKFISTRRHYEAKSFGILKRLVICNGILKNPNLIDEPIIFETLLELSPSFSWEQRIEELSKPSERNRNFIFMMENLKWKRTLDLICHPDFENFMKAVEKRSRLIKKLLRQIYRGE